MRKLVVGAMGFHGRRHAGARRPLEDPTKGFKLGGGEMPYFDGESGEALDRVRHEAIGPARRFGPVWFVVQATDRDSETRRLRCRRLSRANADAVAAAGKDYLFAMKDEHRTMCCVADAWVRPDRSGLLLERPPSPRDAPPRYNAAPCRSCPPTSHP